MQLLTKYLISEIDNIRSIADKALENPDVGQLAMWEIISDMDKKAMELGEYIEKLDRLLPGTGRKTKRNTAPRKD